MPIFNVKILHPRICGAKKQRFLKTKFAFNSQPNLKNQKWIMTKSMILYNYTQVIIPNLNPYRISIFFAFFNPGWLSTKCSGLKLAFSQLSAKALHTQPLTTTTK